MFRMVTVGSIALLALGATACGAAEEEEASGAWEGETPHFSASGRMNGEEVSADLSGEAASSGEELRCVRYYRVPVVDGAPDPSQATQLEIRIEGPAIFAGEPMIFEMDVGPYAFQDETPGLELAIAPREGDEPPPDEIFLEWAWENEAEEDVFEGNAQDGHFVLGLADGTPGEGGVIIPEGEGHFGGYVEARWAVDETVKVSFTARCMENRITEYIP